MSNTATLPRVARPGTPRGATLRASVLAVLAGTLLLLTGGAAQAHAILLSVDPADGETVESAPDAVRLTFNEPVQVTVDGVRVFDADATRVDEGALETGDGSVVGVQLPADLPDGGYVVTYRVTSADSHPIAGVTTFVVGEGSVDDALVGALTDAEAAGAGPATDLVRWASYLTVLLAGGLWIIGVTTMRRPADRGMVRELGRGIAILGLGVTGVAVVVQAATLSGGGLGAVTEQALLTDIMGSGFGQGVVVRVLGLLLLLVAWQQATSRIAAVLAGAGAVAAVSSFALDGHQRATDPVALMIGADVVHLLGAATWFAGLVVLAMLLRSRAARRDPVAVAAVVARFSTVALISVGVLSLAGVAMAVPLVGAGSALLGTDYGLLLVAKTVAVALVVAVAAYNRQRLVPLVRAVQIPAGASGGVETDTVEPGTDATGTVDARATRIERAWRRLRRTVSVEAGLLVAVLGITGVLVSTQPAVEAAGLSGYYEVTAPLDDGLELDLVVDPNRTGLNTIHLYVLDENGRPSADVTDVTLELTFVPQDIGPITIEPLFAGTGHWIATTDELSFPGDWELRVVAGVDRFTESNVTLDIPVAP
ncbi:MAG: copper resistance protein CopC/CopD [Nitriliruptoraceae bacterium]|nr:copper resistance protein CopC/CopD [Nitriliruptoraceae bacterium]